MEVRAAYAEEDFEWDSCKQLAVKGTREANIKLLRQYAASAFKTEITQDDVSSTEGGTL